MQNVLKRKNMYFDEKICKIYSFGPVCVIKIYNFFFILLPFKNINYFNMNISRMSVGIFT